MENKIKSKQLSPFGREFWLNKGLTIEQADFERNSRRPICKEYWIKKGFSNEESIEKAIECKHNNNKKGAMKNASRPKQEQRECSKRCVEYWIKTGLSVEDAIQRVSKHQSTFSLEKCIEKYGYKEGREKWKERQDKWQKTLKNTIEQNPLINKLKGSCLNYNELILKYTRDEIKENMKKRGIYLYDTREQLETYINMLLLDKPELYYTSVNNFKHFGISKLQLDFAGVDETIISSKLIKDNIIYRGSRNYICMKTTKGQLRSSFEIYFYTLLLKYNINEFDIGKCYPNSSFRYDFFLPHYNLYIEICPLYNKDEKYTIKMNKKKELFGCVLLDNSKEFEPFLKELINENNSR